MIVYGVDARIWLVQGHRPCRFHMDGVLDRAELALRAAVSVLARIWDEEIAIRNPRGSSLELIRECLVTE